MRMKDGDSGKVLWERSDWDLTTDHEEEVHFPASMLACRAIGREITFYS